MNIYKKINERCKKTKMYYRCGALNGVVKKAGPFKIVGGRTFNTSTMAKRVLLESEIAFEQSFKEAGEN